MRASLSSPPYRDRTYAEAYLKLQHKWSSCRESQKAQGEGGWVEKVSKQQAKLLLHGECLSESGATGKHFPKPP